MYTHLALAKLKIGMTKPHVLFFPPTNLPSLLIAYEYAMQQKVRYINDILQALLTARKKKWDGEEVKRLEREWELLRYVKSLVEAERIRQLDQIVDKDDTEKVEEINYNSVNPGHHLLYTVFYSMNGTI